MRSITRGAVLVASVVVHLAVLYAPRVPATDVAGLPGADKVGHVVVFALVVTAALWAEIPARIVLPVLLGHAVVSELLQHLVLAGRSGDPWDVLADVVGVALGWMAWRLILAVRRAGRGPSGPGR